MNTITAGRIAGGFAIAMFAASAAFAATTPAASGDQKTLMKTCNAEATQKGLKGDDRKSFMKSCLSGQAAAAATTTATSATDQQALMKTCNDQAKGKKGDDRKAFMKTCLSGGKSDAAAAAPGTASTAGKPGWHSTATSAPVTPATAVAPAAGLAPATTPKPASNKPLAPKPQGNGQATLAKLGTNQFQTEGQAQGHCASSAVVWVNTDSKIYHYKGYSDYGTTKASAFMCEADAKSAGDRAAKDEKAPH